MERPAGKRDGSREAGRTETEPNAISKEGEGSDTPASLASLCLAWLSGADLSRAPDDDDYDDNEAKQ